MSQIKARLLAITNQTLPYSKQCLVVSVDEDALTCVVDPMDGGSYYTDVLLSVGENANYAPIPAVDSVVIISFLDEFTAFVSMCSNLKYTKHNSTNTSNKSQVTSLREEFNKLATDVKTYITDMQTQINALQLPHYMGPTSGPPTNVAAFQQATTTLSTKLDTFKTNIDTIYKK